MAYIKSEVLWKKSIYVDNSSILTGFGEVHWNLGSNLERGLPVLYKMANHLENLCSIRINFDLGGLLMTKWNSSSISVTEAGASGEVLLYLVDEQNIYIFKTKARLSILITLPKQVTF